MALRGSVCLYEGEELGLPEAEVPFELIQDPYGKVFWPEFKGRDGCRTPMVWDKDKPNGGFSSANRTWLPIPREHVELAASARGEQNAAALIDDYRRFIRIRKEHAALRTGSIEFLDSPGDILAFLRRDGAETILCVFNFGKEPARWHLPQHLTPHRTLISAQAEDTGSTIALGPMGAIYITVTAGEG